MCRYVYWSVPVSRPSHAAMFTGPLCWRWEFSRTWEPTHERQPGSVTFGYCYYHYYYHFIYDYIKRQRRRRRDVPVATISITHNTLIIERRYCKLTVTVNVQYVRSHRYRYRYNIAFF